jgi:hypothetical protein
MGRADQVDQYRINELEYQKKSIEAKCQELEINARSKV